MRIHLVVIAFLLSFLPSLLCWLTCSVEWFAKMNSTHELSSPPPSPSPLSVYALLALCWFFSFSVYSSASFIFVHRFPVWDNNTCQTQFSVVCVCVPSSVLLMWIKSLVSRKMALCRSLSLIHSHSRSLMGHSGIRTHSLKEMPCELFNMLAQINWKSRENRACNDANPQ